MSFVERFKKRKKVSPTVQVELASGEDKVTLTVARFAQEEINAALLEAESRLAKNGLPRAEHDAFFSIEFSRALCSKIKQHVKGWTIDGEEIAFSKENLNLMMGELTLDDELKLVDAYQRAIADDEKKILNPKDTQDTSATDSSAG